MDTGWILDEGARLALLERWPPAYGQVVAHHVTFVAAPDDPEPGRVPPPVDEAWVVGHVDDGEGVEALVVAINGSTERPDGKTWHVTWSLGPGRQAQESNDVIARLGWRSMDGGPLLLQPASW